jgi:hypothetical protein
MTNRFLPTEQERDKIDRITSWRSRLFLFLTSPMAALGISRIVPEEGIWLWLATGMAIVAVVVLLVVAGYVSFGLRCPRCSSWVGVTVPKCASCGLRFDAPKSAAVPTSPR